VWKTDRGVPIPKLDADRALANQPLIKYHCAAFQHLSSTATRIANTTKVHYNKAHDGHFVDLELTGPTSKSRVSADRGLWPASGTHLAESLHSASLLRG